MIKFWKSAAKGKTGCPVRPPEVNLLSAPDLKTLISTQSLDENEDINIIFEKNSKLSLSLHNILIEKKGIKYFAQFMESASKGYLIKCWLDMEQFKTMLANTMSTCNDKKNHFKINRAQSFEMQIEKNKTEHYAWDNNSESLRGPCSASSCVNLTEHHLNFKKSEVDDNTKNSNYTEAAIMLFKKYVALEAPYKLDLPDDLIKSVISNICQQEGMVKEDCFKPVQDIIFNQINNDFYSDFLNSPLYIKAQLDILTSCSLNLNDILYNETILFYFTEYLEQESCRILLEFLMAVIHFRDNLVNENMSTNKMHQIQDDAIVLYEKYFSLQATNPVGFPTDIRLKVESEICRDGGLLPSCFDLPYRIVFKTLNQFVKTFLESELYYKYLSEMIHSVDQMWLSNHKSHSDCSSEFSISTQNTLLAMGDPFFRKKKRNLSVPDMTIDSNQLYNADALWQRNRQDGLSLGRVNSLGRFESKFEPDPDKKSKSVLKKMVSKFVPISTSKVEEEMAWQIAHMIVKDITDLTMAPPDNEDL